MPTRLAFGLEEVWQNELPLAQDGPSKFKVIGRYFAGQSCLMLNLGLPACPTNREPDVSNTTHPDQQEGLWIPDGLGGVTLALGNDGGFYKQHTTATSEMDNGGWGDGNQEGFQTLLPYDVAMANDGTVWAGLQDNGHLKIDSRTREQFETFGGDGTFAEVDPANCGHRLRGVRLRRHGGHDGRRQDVARHDPADHERPLRQPVRDGFERCEPPRHGRQRGRGDDLRPETTGQTTPPVLGDPTPGGIATSALRPPVDEGLRPRHLQSPGDSGATPSTTDPANQVSALDTHGETTYVAYCGLCDILNAKRRSTAASRPTSAATSRPSA